MRRASLEALDVVPVTHNPAIGKKVMFGSNVAPGLTNFSQAVFSPGQVATGHRHDDMCEVFFVRRGRARITVEDVEHDLAAGECMLIESGEHHEVANPFEEDLMLLYFGLRDSRREATR